MQKSIKISLSRNKKNIFSASPPKKWNVSRRNRKYVIDQWKSLLTPFRDFKFFSLRFLGNKKYYLFNQKYHHNKGTHPGILNFFLYNLIIFVLQI